MSIGSRVIYWLRGELNAIFRPEGWPRDRRPHRRQAGSASSEHEPNSEGGGGDGTLRQVPIRPGTRSLLVTMLTLSFLTVPASTQCGGPGSGWSRSTTPIFIRRMSRSGARPPSLFKA